MSGLDSFLFLCWTSPAGNTCDGMVAFGRCGRGKWKKTQNEYQFEIPAGMVRGTMYCTVGDVERGALCGSKGGRRFG